MLRYKVDITLDQDDLEITLSSSCFTIDDSTLDEGFFYVIPKDDCTEKTFTVVIKCGDTTFTNTYKICTDYQDCTSCEVCTDGLCLEKCEQHCNEGDCVECTSNTHCANNLICVQGNCVCPGNLKLDGEGKCVECLADDECSACAKCIEGGCVSTICPPFLNSEGCLVESLCFNNNCVQCINNSTCEANEVCTDFTCICAPGYVRSLITGLCEPIPLCVDDECPACYSCNSGNCVPIICPEGYICVNGRLCTALYRWRLHRKQSM
jgi:hypothetical protein